MNAFDSTDRGDESWMHAYLLFSEVIVHGHSVRNQKQMQLSAEPQIVAEEDSTIHSVLYKAGGLIFRKSQETSALQIAVLLNNNSVSFLGLKFALKIFLRKNPAPAPAVTSLVDAFRAHDREHDVPRPWLWRKHEVSALMSLEDEQPHLHPAFFDWEEKKVITILKHHHLCQQLAKIAKDEHNRRSAEQQDDDSMFNYRWKWDIPKGSHELQTMSESAKDEIVDEMGISKDALPDPSGETSLEEPIPGRRLILKNSLLCFYIPDDRFSNDGDKPTKAQEFTSNCGHMGDSAWCDVDALLEDLESAADCPKYWAIPSSMRVSRANFASQLRTTISEIELPLRLWIWDLIYINYSDEEAKLIMNLILLVICWFQHIVSISLSNLTTWTVASFHVAGLVGAGCYRL